MPSSSALPLFLLGLVLAPRALAADVAACYLADGSDAGDAYFPCDASATTSGCCTLADICLSSGLCYSQVSGHEGLVFLNGCTLKDGSNDPACPQSSFCKGITTESINSWNVLQCEPNVWCCRLHDDTTNCCSNTTENVVFTASVGSLLGAPQTTVPASTASSTTSSGPTTFPPASNGACVTTTTTVVGGSSTGGVDRASASTCPEDHTAAVGGAVGGVLGAALLGALGAIAYLLKRGKSRAPEGGASVVGSPPSYRDGPHSYGQVLTNSPSSAAGFGAGSARKIISEVDARPHMSRPSEMAG